MRVDGARDANRMSISVCSFYQGCSGLDMGSILIRSRLDVGLFFVQSGLDLVTPTCADPDWKEELSCDQEGTPLNSFKFSVFPEKTQHVL